MRLYGNNSCTVGFLDARRTCICVHGSFYVPRVAVAKKYRAGFRAPRGLQLVPGLVDPVLGIFDIPVWNIEQTLAIV